MRKFDYTKYKRILYIGAFSNSLFFENFFCEKKSLIFDKNGRNINIKYLIYLIRKELKEVYYS